MSSKRNVFHSSGIHIDRIHFSPSQEDLSIPLSSRYSHRCIYNNSSIYRHLSPLGHESNKRSKPRSRDGAGKQAPSIGTQLVMNPSSGGCDFHHSCSSFPYTVDSAYNEVVREMELIRMKCSRNFMRHFYTAQVPFDMMYIKVNCNQACLQQLT